MHPGEAQSTEIKREKDIAVPHPTLRALGRGNDRERRSVPRETGKNPGAALSPFLRRWATYFMDTYFGTSTPRRWYRYHHGGVAAGKAPESRGPALFAPPLLPPSSAGSHAA